MSSVKILLGSALALMATCVFAAEPAQPTDPATPSATAPSVLTPPTTASTPEAHQAMKPDLGSNVTYAKTLPTKKIAGLSVRNGQGEKIGTVDDMVINLETGKVAYVALSVGGVLGVGDKLFAVPFEELTFNHGKDGLGVVLNITKERLQAAPGFNKEQWPDFANPQWRSTNDNYYRHTSANDHTSTYTSRTTPAAP